MDRLWSSSSASSVSSLPLRLDHEPPPSPTQSVHKGEEMDESHHRIDAVFSGLILTSFTIYVLSIYLPTIKQITLRVLIGLGYLIFLGLFGVLNLFESVLLLREREGSMD